MPPVTSVLNSNWNGRLSKLIGPTSGMELMPMSDTDNKSDDGPTNDEAQNKIKMIGAKLRERFQEILDEPIPQDILDLLDELERAERNRDGD